MTAAPAPAKLAGVTAAGGAGQATLGWTDPSNANILRYEYRQKSGEGSYGTWTTMTGVGASGTSYVVTGLAKGSYTYQVRAVTEGGGGPASDEAAASVTPVAPVCADGVEGGGGAWRRGHGDAELDGAGERGAGGCGEVPVPVVVRRELDGHCGFSLADDVRGDGTAAGDVVRFQPAGGEQRGGGRAGLGLGAGLDDAVAAVGAAGVERGAGRGNGGAALDGSIERDDHAVRVPLEA